MQDSIFIMLNKFFSSKFLNSMKAKGIDTKQLLKQVCADIEHRALMDGNLNDSKVIKPSFVRIDIEMECCPIDEKSLARIVGLSRATLADWREKGHLPKFKQVDRLRYYERLSALRKIYYQLLDSPRSELLNDEIFKDIL